MRLLPSFFALLLTAGTALADQPFAGTWASEHETCDTPWLTLTDDTLRDGAELSCTINEVTETAPGTFAAMVSCNGKEAEDWTIRVHDGTLVLINAIDFGDGRMSRWQACN